MEASTQPRPGSWGGGERLRGGKHEKKESGEREVVIWIKAKER